MKETEFEETSVLKCLPALTRNLSPCSTSISVPVHVDEIPKAFADGMFELCELHSRTGVGESGEYLSPKWTDKLDSGCLVLPTYSESTEFLCRLPEALFRVNNGIREVHTRRWTGTENLKKELIELSESLSHTTWFVLSQSLLLLPVVIGPPMVMVSLVQPEIAPPIARTVDRDPVPLVYKHMNTETLKSPPKSVGTHIKRVADGIMTMLEKTGLLHGYSFNSWSDMVTYDEDFIAEWLRSPQTSMYYSLQVMGDVQDKSDAYAALSERWGWWLPISPYWRHLNLNVIVKNESLRKTNCS